VTGSAVPPFAHRLHHVGIATADLACALAFYRDTLGMRVTADEVVEDQGIRAVFLAAGAIAAHASTEVELLVATREDSAIARFLAKRGPGVHHLAYEVGDLAAALADCRARGLRLVDESPRRGARGHLVAFMHPTAADGVLVELVEGPRGPLPGREDRA